MRGRIGAPSEIGRRVGSRAALLGATLVCALGLALAANAPSASAVPNGHVFDYEFGGEGTGAGQFNFIPCIGCVGIAVEHSTGNYYVTDGASSRVQKFDEDGNFLLMWGFGVATGANALETCSAPGPCQAGLYGSAPGQMQTPHSIAVDNSTGPNAGVVYVADIGAQLVFKYSPTGTYLGKIDGTGSPDGVFQTLGQRRAVDVDGTGAVWVLEQHPTENNQSRIMRFSNQPSNTYVGGSQWTPEFSESGQNAEPFAAHSEAVTADGGAVYLTEYCQVLKFTANGASFQTAGDPIGGRFCSGHGSEIAVDFSNGHLLVFDEGEIQEYDEQFNKVGPKFHLGGSNAIAVDPGSGTVYVAESPMIKAYKARRVPEAQTLPATNVLHTTATINAQTAPDPIEGGDVSECFFQYGFTTTYEYTAPCDQATPFSTTTQVKADLTGLLMDEMYHFRIAVKNSVDINYGPDKTFFPRAVLDTDTGDATNLTASTATVSGSFTPAGEETDYYFQWGKNKDAYNNSTPLVEDSTTSGSTQVFANLSGLEDYTTYYYRIVTTNSLGTSKGPDRSFQTTPPELPTIVGTKASEVTANSAALSSAVTPNFGETFHGFEYGETAAYGTQVLEDKVFPADDQSHPFGTQIDGLIPGRTYHYRAIAINFGGISYSPDLTFTTLDLPAIVSTDASSVTATGAQLQALVSPSLSPTTVRFEYGTGTAYGSSTAPISIGAGAGAVPASSDVVGLTPGTQYHFRAVATNPVGTALGPDQTLTTGPGAPPEVKPKRAKCKRGFVKRKGRCVKKPKRKAKNKKSSAKGGNR